MAYELKPLPYWYVMSTATGTATLCAGEIDARREAQAYDRLYPGAAPHVATRLVPVEYADEIERLTAEVEAKKKAANHWFTEANKEHNRAELLLEILAMVRDLAALYAENGDPCGKRVNNMCAGVLWPR